MFSIFSSKKKFLSTGLLDGMTDVHCHLLPGVDDGMPSIEKAKEAIKWLEQVGVKEIWLTPHNMEECPKNNRKYLQEQFELFLKECPSGISFHLAGEYMLDMSFYDRLNENPCTLGNSFLLVETSYMSAPADFWNMLYKVTLSGYTPIIAHPERYMYMEEQDYRQLKQKGYLFQLNIMSLCGVYGRLPYEKAMRFLKEGTYDLIGSDLHRLGIYRQALERLKVSTKEIALLKLLFENNKSLK